MLSSPVASLLLPPGRIVSTSLSCIGPVPSRALCMASVDVVLGIRVSRLFVGSFLASSLHLGLHAAAVVHVGVDRASVGSRA